MISMNSYTKLKRNTIIFLFGSFGSKILSVILLPYYTNILSTEEFGKAELLLTSAGLLIPLISCSITDAVLRFSMDNSYEKKNVLNWGLIVILFGNFVGILLYPLLCIFIEKNLVPRLYIYMICMSIYGLFSSFIKGVGKTVIYAIGGLIYTITYSVSNIVMLSVMKLGVLGYIDSSIVACIVASTYYFFFANLKEYLLMSGRKNSLILREMLKYSIPLIPNNISWWISNSSDKYLINLYIGTSETGLYSIAYRVPNLINTVASVFINAWQLAAIENLDKKESNKFYVTVYNIYFRYMVLISTFIILLSNFISKVLFSRDFYHAGVFIPVLVLAAFFCNLSTFVGGILTAYKSTKVIFASTTAGAVINIILNLIVIPFWGGIGAAWTTCISYVIMFGMRIIFLYKNMGISLCKKKHYCIIILLFMQAILFPYLDYMNVFFVALIVGIYIKNILVDIRNEIKKL